MAIFHYKDSPIERIETKSPRQGILQATIIFKDAIDPAQLEKLRERLGADKITTLMDSVDGHTALQVRGLTDEKALLAAVKDRGFAPGEVEKELTAQDQKKLSFSERIRGKSLFLSALFYDLGNIAFFVSGIQRGRHNRDGKLTPHDKSEIMIGAAFSVGDVLMTAYGKDRGDEELNAVASGLKQHLHRKGIAVPEGDALNPDSIHQTGLLKATSRWLHKHILHVKCLTEFAGGLFTIHASLKPGNVNRGKLAAGLLIAVGWLATFLLEKPRGHRILDGDGPASPSIVDKIKDNPRGWIARPLAMGNNVANLWGALNPKDGERQRFRDDVMQARASGNAGDILYAQNKQYDFIWNVISACAFLVAHTLFGVSGAKRPRETEDDKSMMQDLVLLSANMLARQPENVRKTAISETAEYVSNLAHVELSKAQVEEAINTKISGLSQSAWADRVQPSAPTGQRTI